MKRARAIGLAALVLACVPAATIAAPSGQAVVVDQNAQIVFGGKTRRLLSGQAVPPGSTIQTGPTGRAQLIFPDQTKIVVGPNSSMTIDETLFAASGVASSFRVSAVGGAFRFITGVSPKPVYQVSTPVATMGVRGTAFDFSVAASKATHLLVYDGRVRFCASGDRCAIVPGGCHAVSLDRAEDFSQPRTLSQKQALLQQQFPLELAQADLRPPFRTDVSGCGKLGRVALPAPVETFKDLNRGGDRGGADGGRSGNPAE